MHRFRRIALIVLDGLGIGEMPDAAEWGDEGADTLGHIVAAAKPRLPLLRQLGLGNIRAIDGLPPYSDLQGCFGKAAILSRGKDTTVGHWEIAGMVTRKPFPTYPDGFPSRILNPFKEIIGCDVLGNKPASGTEIIREFGAEHMKTGNPIVYTSADSVFQIAAHEHVVPLEELYKMCRIARTILEGEDCVARVIARPFIGSPGNFKRTDNRKDLAVSPPGRTLLDYLKDAGLATVSVGKIASIFNFTGVTGQFEAHENAESIDQMIKALGQASEGIIFANLVDFDMKWGHRRDSEGFAKALEYFDDSIPRIQGAMQQDDCLIITADHGCDPTARGSDHTREYVPILVYGKNLSGGVNLGTRATLADMGQTVADNFGLKLPVGTSFLGELR